MKLQSEKEYNDWIKTFYTGSFLIKGWDDRKKEVLSYLSEKKDEVAALLDEAGEIIAPEWAKDNSVRKIDNSDLMHWGDQMKKAAKVSADSIISVINGMKDEAAKRVQS